MKKKYTNLLLTALGLVSAAGSLSAQCTTPNAPSVSGSTVAGCTSSSAFTLTANSSPTNAVGWYANSFGGNALSSNSVFTSPTLTSGTTYYVGQSVSGITASMTLNTPASPYNGYTRGLWFTAPVDFVITGLRVPLDVTGTANSGIAVMKFSSIPPTYATTTNSFNTLYLNQAITGTNVVAVNIPVYTGDIIGILGERGSYTSYGTSPYTSTLGVGTTTLTMTRLGMQYDLSSNLPQDLFTESGGSIGRMEIYTTLSCNSTLTPVTVTVIPAPQVTITGPAGHICANSSYTLNSSGASTYTWSGGPQTSSYVVTPSTNTTYSLTGSLFGNCSSSLTAITISVDPAAPTVSVSSSSASVCSGNTLALNGIGATTYSWSGGAITPTNNVAFFPTATQQYTLVGGNSCGTGSAAISVTVNQTPVLTVAVSSSSVICEGQTATLTASGAATYSWTNNTSPGAVTVVSPTTATSYNLMGVSNAGCPAMSSQIIIVNPNPTVSVGAVQNKTLVCAGGSATLTSSGADTYSWTSGAITSTNLVNPTSTTVYTVTGTYTMTQCSATNAIAVTIFSPVLAVSADTTVCNGSAVTLTANAGTGTTYTWSTGSPFASTNITATVAASYSVIALTSTLNGVKCPSTATVQLNIYANPTVNVVATRTAICKGEKLILTASGGTAYAWANLSQTTATIQVSPTVVNVTTTYSVTGTDANGCSKSATIGVKVNACTGIDEIEKEENVIAVYPNPNNGNFTISSKSNMDVSLINELGQVIKVLSFNEENQFQQNVQGLSKGIYFIKGIHNGVSVQNKLVVN